MKKRRSLIVALLIIATLMMTVGYAVLNTELQVTGTAGTVVEGTKLVYTGTASVIDGIEYVKNNAETKASATAGNISATFTVNGLVKEGDYATAKFEIQNNNTYSYKIQEPTVAFTGTNDFYTAEVHYLDAEGNPIDPFSEFTIAGGATAYFTVKVSLTNDTSSAKKSGNFTVSLPAVSID